MLLKEGGWKVFLTVCCSLGVPAGGVATPPLRGGFCKISFLVAVKLTLGFSSWPLLSNRFSGSVGCFAADLQTTIFFLGELSSPSCLPLICSMVYICENALVTSLNYSSLRWRSLKSTESFSNDSASKFRSSEWSPFRIMELKRSLARWSLSKSSSETSSFVLTSL